MELKHRVESVKSREDFVAFVRDLLRDFEERPESWENRDLETFLEAMAAWTEDADDRNAGGQAPRHPEWAAFARILVAARMYE